MMRIKSILPIFFFLFISLNSLSFASHILGGEIYYDSLGNNQYKITIEIYRDCNSGTTYDNPLYYTVFLGDGSYYGEFDVALFSNQRLDLAGSASC